MLGLLREVAGALVIVTFVDTTSVGVDTLHTG
jgi:hypothetical protein